MPRNFVDGNSVRFTPYSFCQVTATLFNGEVIDALEPRRLFPKSGPEEYISFLDPDGKEQMIVQSLALLDDDSAKAIRECLIDYYRVPEITSFDSTTIKFNILKFFVTTKFGKTSFNVASVTSDIKLLYGTRVLIKDSRDNRYEVPDISKLDKNSLRIITSFF